MKVESLAIHRHYTDKFYEGTVTFSNEAGQITLRLDDAFSRSVFQLAGDALVEAAKETAERMTATVIDAQIGLKGPEDYDENVDVDVYPEKNDGQE